MFAIVPSRRPFLVLIFVLFGYPFMPGQYLRGCDQAEISASVLLVLSLKSSPLPYSSCTKLEVHCSLAFYMWESSGSETIKSFSNQLHGHPHEEPQAAQDMARAHAPHAVTKLPSEARLLLY